MSAEAALAKLEARVLASGNVGRWLKTVDRLRRMLATEAPGVKAVVLALANPKLEAAALAAVLEAFDLGVADAVSLVNEDGSPRNFGKPTKGAREPVKGVDKAGASAVRQAQLLARSGADAATYLAPIFGHANRVRGSVSDAVNRAGNEGTTAVADAAGLPTVWVAETDACVHCLAYAGQVCKPGGTFPGGLTYGRKSYYPSRIATPPRHPRCRCTVEPLISAEYAATLKREADRSVLRGFSLESESMAVRVDAADRLLKKGVTAPKSVKSYASRAVREGAFPNRGRA